MKITVVPEQTTDNITDYVVSLPLQSFSQLPYQKKEETDEVIFASEGMTFFKEDGTFWLWYLSDRKILTDSEGRPLKIRNDFTDDVLRSVAEEISLNHVPSGLIVDVLDPKKMKIWEKAWHMNEIVSSFNDEDAYFGNGWLMIWPDGADREECQYDFEDEDSLVVLERSFIGRLKYFAHGDIADLYTTRHLEYLSAFLREYGYKLKLNGKHPSTDNYGRPIVFRSYSLTCIDEKIRIQRDYLDDMTEDDDARLGHIMAWIEINFKPAVGYQTVHDILVYAAAQKQGFSATKAMLGALLKSLSLTEIELRQMTYYLLGI